MPFHDDFFSDLLALESGPRDSNDPWNGILNASSETAGPFYCRFACDAGEIEGERVLIELVPRRIYLQKGFQGDTNQVWYGCENCSFCRLATTSHTYERARTRVHQSR